MVGDPPSMNQTIIPSGPAQAPSSPAIGLRAVAAIAAVLLGAMISTLTSRITSLGLADVRGALGVGFDEGAWINTAFTASQMFIGPIAVWAAFVFGTRRVLIAGATVFLVVQTVLPLCAGFAPFIFCQAASGLSSGVFVPLTVGFVVRSLPPKYIPFGIAAYAMNLEMSLNISATLEGWYSEHLSWHWLFWQNAALTLPFLFCLLIAVSDEPLRREPIRGDYPGMLLGACGFACLVVALDQGERLFWFQSPFINVMMFSGVVLVAALIVRESVAKTPGIALSYLFKPNVALLLALVGLIRFAVLNTSFIPSLFLASVHGLRPLQVGETLRWVAVPQILFAPCVALLLLRIDARRVILIGFAVIALAFALGTQLTPDWAEGNFIPSQLLQALGQTMALTSIIFFLGKHVTAEHALTFGAVAQTTRLFSGQLGTTSIALTQRIMEQISSNVLGIHLNVFDPQAVERIKLQASLLGMAIDNNTSLAPPAAFAVLDQSIRTQATTLALAANFRLAALCAIGGMAIAMTLRRLPK
jgi:DHA2 family multidrug resistance protein